MRNTQTRNFRTTARRTGLNVVPSPAVPNSIDEALAYGKERPGDVTPGIEVQEEELEAVVAQRVYKMRCACGRSWFEIELKKFVTCPACRRLGLVTPDVGGKAAL
jgi:hypothetical protein